MQGIRSYVGLDVHKNSISVAFVSCESGEAESLGSVPNDLTRLLRKLAPLGAPATVRICYEAGPTGYGLYRKLRELHYDCQVVAPAKTPQLPGDRVKTDRRDALKLAMFLATGHLTPIRVPTPEEEALRDLVRFREDLKSKETNSKRQLNSMMLRHDRIFRSGKSFWTKMHFDWLEAQVFEAEASNLALQGYIGEVRRYVELIAEVDRNIAKIAETIEQAPLVHALRAFKGIKTLTATIIVAEVGDLKRFPSADKFASFLGLTPSESSSGDTRNRGRITKAGNGRVRRALVEAAWAYWRSPHVSRELESRSEGVTSDVRDLAWKTQRRLHKRLRALQARHVSAKKALVAVTRELACAIWALGQKEFLVQEQAA